MSKKDKEIQIEKVGKVPGSAVGLSLNDDLVNEIKEHLETVPELVGPRGQRGEGGEQGRRGRRGLKGETGETGDHGVDGAIGGDGVKGDKGVIGLTGRQGVGAQGPRGAKGLKGDQGDTGPKGDKGEQGRTGPGGGRGGRAASHTPPFTSISLVGTDLVFARGKEGPLGPDVVADLSALAGGGGAALPEFQFFADQFENPNNADWVVNALAPAVADSNNAGLTIRLFDDTAEEGVGFTIKIPATATNIIFAFVGRAETAPGAVNTVGLNIYNRGIPDNAAVQAFSAATQLADLDIPTNEFFQNDTQTLTLATLGLTAGETTQFELTRVAPTGGTNLPGNWDLLLCKVSFT
jgi:hypothetical protein